MKKLNYFTGKLSFYFKRKLVNARNKKDALLRNNAYKNLTLSDKKLFDKVIEISSNYSDKIFIDLLDNEIIISIPDLTLSLKDNVISLYNTNGFINKTINNITFEYLFKFILNKAHTNARRIKSYSNIKLINFLSN